MAGAWARELTFPQRQPISSQLVEEVQLVSMWISPPSTTASLTLGSARSQGFCFGRERAL